MVCVVVPLLLKQNTGVLFGVFRGPRSEKKKKTKKKQNSMALVRKRTIPTEQPPLVGDLVLQVGVGCKIDDLAP
jgi:hypothetical protein